MQQAQRNVKRSLRHRVGARGAIVRKHRHRLCAEISGNCRPKHNAIHRSCTRLGIISKDPIGFAAGDANLYRYVGNGPTTKTDPSGLQEFIPLIPIPADPPIMPLPPGYDPDAQYVKGVFPELKNKSLLDPDKFNYDYGDSLVIGFSYDGKVRNLGPYTGFVFQCFNNDNRLLVPNSMIQSGYTAAGMIIRKLTPRRILRIEIVGHGGTPRHPGVAGPFNKSSMNLPGISDLLKAMANKNPSEVILRTCYTAGDQGFVQDLANRLGAPVFAGDGYYFGFNWGDWWVAYPNDGGVHPTDPRDWE